MIDRTPITDRGAWEGCPAYAMELDPAWAAGSDGDADSPTGYFDLYVSTDHNPPCIIRGDNRGFRTVVELESDQHARALYDALASAHADYSMPVYEVAFLQGEEGYAAADEIDDIGAEAWIDTYADEYHAGLNVDSADRHEWINLDWFGDYALGVSFLHGWVALYARVGDGDILSFGEVLAAADGVASVD